MAGKLGSLNINLALDSVQFSQGLERAQKSAVKFATTTNSNLNSIEQNVQRLTRSIPFAFPSSGWPARSKLPSGKISR